MEARMARLFLAMLMFLPLIASAADETRVSFLEQEVRNLQRQVQMLSRQMDELRTRPDRPEPLTARPGSASGAATVSLPRWVDGPLWRRLRTGTSELDVISSLGPPTTMREENGARVLLYAMEVGQGFLGGSIVLRDHAVVEIRQPTLQ
jgi:hypothetical protein